LRLADFKKSLFAFSAYSRSVVYFCTIILILREETFVSEIFFLFCLYKALLIGCTNRIELLLQQVRQARKKGPDEAAAGNLCSLKLKAFSGCHWVMLVR
jgi:hypothetical protein